MNGVRVLVVMDSFKGNISGLEASAAVGRGVKRACPWAEIKILPIADGGEGTVDVFIKTLGGELREGQFTSPIGDPIAAAWGLLPDGNAVIELAAASGLPRVPLHQRNPLFTTTRGTGEQILAALDAGCRSIVLGLGGSATNDGAMGIMTALGAQFLDGSGAELSPCGAFLKKVERIDLSGLDSRLKETELLLACDVQNRLCGPSGAAAVYGPQKGATESIAAELDAGLRHYAKVIQRATGRDVLDLPGSGAAGGVGGGLTGLLGARLIKGIDMLARITRLDAEIEKSDVIFTGEGRIDIQTTQGKVISGIAARAKARNIPLIALVGSIRGHIGPLMSMGLTAIFPIGAGPCPFPMALQHSLEDLERTASQIIRVMRGVKRHKSGAGRKNQYRRPPQKGESGAKPSAEFRGEGFRT